MEAEALLGLGSILLLIFLQYRKHIHLWCRLGNLVV